MVYKILEIVRFLMQILQLFLNDQVLVNGVVFVLDFRKYSMRIFFISFIIFIDINNINSISFFKDFNGMYIKVLFVYLLLFFKVDGLIGVEIIVLEKLDVRFMYWVLVVCINNSNLCGKMIDQRVNGFNIVINFESVMF